MDIRVIKFRKPDGTQGVFITDEFGLPACIDLQMHLSCAFSGRSFNTKDTYARTLAFIFRYFTTNGIDIPKRVESGELFTREELKGFFSHCQYDVNSDFTDESNVTSLQRFSGKRLDMLIHASTSAESLVKSSTVKLRLGRFRGYIEWLHRHFHFYANPTSGAANRYATLVREISDEIGNLKDQNNETKDPFDSVIPDDVYERLLKSSDPFASDNPFKGSRHRNQLIIYLLTESGIRKSALLKLKLSDIKDDWDNPRVLITRTPDDPSDPRKHKPAQKTKAHSSALSKETMAALIFYIKHIRIQFLTAEDHDFVFVAEKGKTAGEPLSITGLNYIFDVLSQHLDFRLTPHMLRHKWHEIFDQNATAEGLTPGVIDDIRINSMGWSENTQMTAIYNEKRLAEKASKLSATRQREQFRQKDNKDV